MKNKKLNRTVRARRTASKSTELSPHELAIYGLSALTVALGVIFAGNIFGSSAGIHAAAPRAETLDPTAYNTTAEYLTELSETLDTRDLTKPFVYEKEFDGRTVYIRFDATQYDMGHSKTEIQAKIADIASGVIHPEMPSED